MRSVANVFENIGGSVQCVLPPRYQARFFTVSYSGAIGQHAVQSHEQFMQRALELASRGSGCTSPNPLVGSVVVHDGQIIGEGWHALYGQAHAEAEAIANALNQLTQPTATDTNKPLRGATIYVTLEPCNHHGLTPPCTQAIIEAGISRVVYALADPNPKAAGGARYLQSQGVEIVQGVLENQARFQNRFFLSHLARRRPYVIAKSATSLDGRIATHTGDSQWITSPESRQRAHQLRQAVDAIIVGANTVIIDDPALTTRLPTSLCAAENIRHPLPVIMDSTGRIPLNRQLLSSASAHTRTIVASGDKMSSDHRQRLESRGLEVVSIAHNDAGVGLSPHAILQVLTERGVQSVLLEGGASLQGSFRDAACIDEVWAFTAPMLIGGSDAPAAYAAIGSKTLGDATRLHDVHVETLGPDVLIRGLVDMGEQSLDKSENTSNSRLNKSTCSQES